MIFSGTCTPTILATFPSIVASLTNSPSISVAKVEVIGSRGYDN